MEQGANVLSTRHAASEDIEATTKISANDRARLPWQGTRSSPSDYGISSWETPVGRNEVKVGLNCRRELAGLGKLHISLKLSS
jgi:hypothetical protein